MRIVRSAITLAGSLVSAACLAGAPQQEAPLPASLVQQVNEARSFWEVKARTRVEFVADNDLWQPGWTYKSGRDWLALVCDGKHCALVAAALTAKHEFWQGHYDDKPTAGQHLTFKQTAAAPGKPVAWFRITGAPPWLKPGAVPSYYAGGPYRQPPGGAGTLEYLVDMPDGEKATLVPMLLPKPLAARIAGNNGQPPDSGALLLQLRIAGKRQVLPGMFGLCSGEVPPGYLLWAGDLDRDGKPDFIVSYVDADGPVHLYLSSAARPGRLVGLASIFDAPPFGGECDGGPPAYLQ